LRREGVAAGGGEAARMDEDERHLTGVGFEAKEAAAPYGKGKSRGARKQVCDGNF